jgi:hypothetical protein
VFRQSLCSQRPLVDVTLGDHDRSLPRVERADDRAIVLGVELADHLIVHRHGRQPGEFAGLQIACMGVLQGCRPQLVCSVLPDRYEQLVWAARPARSPTPSTA